MNPTMILAYDTTGRPLYTVNHPWPDALPGLLEADATPHCICDEMPIDRVWVDISTGVAHAREPGPWTATSLECAAGSDFVIDGLPAGVTVTVGSQTYTVDDGEFTFSSDNPGAFHIRVDHWPFLSDTYAVTFS